MSKLFITREELFQKLKRGRSHEQISKNRVNECLDLLQKKADIRKKIEELEKENNLLQKQVEGSTLYILHGGAYCKLLEILSSQEIKDR